MEPEGDAAPEGMLTYLQMRRCLLRLGYTWNRSLPTSTTSNTSDQYDDDVSVMSASSANTGSGSKTTSGGASSSSTAAARDIIATDAQLIMLLTTLVEMEERQRAARLGKNYDDGEEETDEGVYSKGLFLPEFIQVSKILFGGVDIFSD